ncbi:MAG TPA: hypothetical protein ENH82_14905 [bacterium]|nr:hypothetical protein [bacterium]
MISKLNQFGYNYTSQYGEDGIIKYVLDKIKRCPKVAVEFGAWDGMKYSNVYSLIRHQGWKGILIEADKKRFEQLCRNTEMLDVMVFNKFIEADGQNSIDELFRSEKLDPNVGVLSIDIDSHDYWIFKYMEYIKPVVVVIEHNDSIPGYIYYHDPEDKVILRSSAKAIEKLGQEKGYKLICCTIANCILVKNEFWREDFFPDERVEYLFDYINVRAIIHNGREGPSPNFYPVFVGIPSRADRILFRAKQRAISILRGISYRKYDNEAIEWMEKFNLFV